MKGLLIKTALFVTSLLLLAVTLSVLYLLSQDIDIVNNVPAPNISNSYSYNDKIQWMRRQNRNAEILSIGSSMSLNNLSSGIITKEVHNDAYLNAASWGTTIKDNYLLLKTLSRVGYKPAVLVMASSTIDFQTENKNVKYNLLKSYLQSDHDYLTIIRSINVPYYLDNFATAQASKSRTSYYTYLGYDKYGTVNFDRVNFKIDSSRWNSDLLAQQPFDEQYQYLDSIASYCNKSRIKLYFFQSPVRAGLSSRMTDDKRSILTRHVKMVKTILNRENIFFVNPDNLTWPDSLYVDGTHFSSAGAQLFTETCFMQARRQQDTNP